MTAAERHTVPGEFGDTERVLVGLGRKPGHEIQLHAPPTLAVGALDRSVKVLLPNEFVDDLTHPPRTRLGREGQTGAASPLDLSSDADRERVHPQTRQRNTHLVAPGVADRLADHLLDTAEIRGRERRQRNFVVSRAGQAVGDHGANLLCRTLPDRPSDHPRLTEPTTPGATPENLHRQPVVHDLCQGYELLLGIGPVTEVGDRALLHSGRDIAVAGRDLGDEPAGVRHLIH